MTTQTISILLFFMKKNPIPTNVIIIYKKVQQTRYLY